MAGMLSISGALLPNPRDLSLWANSMIRPAQWCVTHALRFRPFASDDWRACLESRVYAVLGRLKTALPAVAPIFTQRIGMNVALPRTTACLPFHVADAKPKMPGARGQSPQRNCRNAGQEL